MHKLNIYSTLTGEHICYHTARSREELLRLYKMYDKIVNPVTNRKVKINSKQGKIILMNYYNKINKKLTPKLVKTREGQIQLFMNGIPMYGEDFQPFYLI